MTKREITEWLYRNADKCYIRTVYDGDGVFCELFYPTTGKTARLPNGEIYSGIEKVINGQADFSDNEAAFALDDAVNSFADNGEYFLLDNQDRFNLNCEYDNDREAVDIQLTDKLTGEITVFNGADIFRQINAWAVKNGL